MIEIACIQCGKGWESLYLPIINKVIEFDDKQINVSDKIGIAYVKEKDGMLKIYLVQPHNASAELIDEIYSAEIKSKEYCEYCGTTENVGVTMNFTYKTCCKECWEKNIGKWNKDSIWKNIITRKQYKMV